MSEMAKKARSEMNAKAHRLAGHKSSGKVDSSSFTPSPDMHTEKKNTVMPAHRSAFKAGGTVHGEMAKHNQGHRPRRAAGGPPPAGIPDAVANMAPMKNDPRMLAAAAMGKANQVSGVPTEAMSFGANKQGLGAQLAGVPHKRGGKAGGNWIAGATKNKGALHRKLGVPEGEKIPEKKLAKAEHSKNPTERKEANLAKTLKGMHHKAAGGAVDSDNDSDDRMGRKSGGKASGKTNINIIIDKGSDDKQQMPPMMPPGGPVRPPMPVGPMAGPGGGGMPPMPPMGGGAPGGGNMGPPPMNQPMPRKDGGVVKMEAGAGGGEGRLEKIRKYGAKPQG